MSDIAKIFSERFEKYRERRIVLYGLGENTEKILAGCKNFQFPGLLDGFSTSGSRFGKPILELKQLPKLQVDILVIVARSSTRGIILERVRAFCVEHSIMVFDVYGRNLLAPAKGGLPFEKTALPPGEKELMAEINRADVISFDLYDTLWTRRLYRFCDVCQMIAEAANCTETFVPVFVRLRQSIEIELSRCGSPHLSDIYSELQRQCGLSDEITKKLMDTEFQVEKKILLPRHKMMQIYERAIATGKPVYLVSDMYFNKQQLTALLQHFGIAGYSGLLVSCEYGCFKKNGLFSALKHQHAGSESLNYLHIGDSLAADVLPAKQHAIQAFQVHSPLALLEISPCHELLMHGTNRVDRVHISMFLNTMFNDPFVLSQPQGQSEHHYALSVLIAPVLINFVFWLIQKLQQDHIKTVLFAARDGFLIKQLYDRIAQEYPMLGLPRSIYFLISRSVSLPCGIYTDEDILKMAHYPFEGPPPLLLQQRFSLDEEDIFPYNEMQPFDSYILQHRSAIMRQTGCLRERFMRYVDSLGIESNSMVAFFDFVSTGTSQVNFQRSANFLLKGYYFVHVKSGPNASLPVDAVETADPQNEEHAGAIYDNYTMLETILTSECPSVKYFSREGSPVYYPEQRPPEHISTILDIHSEVRSYLDDFLFLLSGCCPNKVDFQLPSYLLTLLQQSSFSSQIMADNRMTYDEFCNRFSAF